MKEPLVWIWGRRPVLEAARAGTLKSIVVASGRKRSPVLEEIWNIAAVSSIPIREVSLQEVERLAPGQNTQGVAAQVVERAVADIGELIDHVASADANRFLLALDQIQDPHNLGSLLRTADAAGVQGVILPERRSASVTGTVAKTSAGAVSHLAIAEVTNLARALNDLREAGVWVVGLDASARQSLFSADLTIPLCLVVGSEEKGLRRLTRQHCDFLVRLPMVGAIESLNASVAGGIALYEVLRQRSQST